MLQVERGELKRRWLRENNKTMKILDAETAEEVERLEAEAKARIASRDAAIADLSLRRRAPGATHEQRALLTELIREIEDEQDQIAEHLLTDRSKLRGRLVAREREILRRTDVRVAVEPLFYVNWHGGSSVNGRPTEIEDLWRSLSRASWCPPSPVRAPADEKSNDAISVGLRQHLQRRRRASRTDTAPKPRASGAPANAQTAGDRAAPSPVHIDPTPKKSPVARTRNKRQAVQPAPTNLLAKSPRFRRAAADIWLQSNRLVSRLARRNDYRDDQLKRLRERHEELRDRTRHLEKQVAGCEAPTVLTEIRDNLTALEELLSAASRGQQEIND
jgi:hypothetical protein